MPDAGGAGVGRQPSVLIVAPGAMLTKPCSAIKDFSAARISKPRGPACSDKPGGAGSSSGNWRWNSTSEAGKSGMAGLQANQCSRYVLTHAPALVTTN